MPTRERQREQTNAPPMRTSRPPPRTHLCSASSHARPLQNVLAKSSAFLAASKSLAHLRELGSPTQVALQCCHSAALARWPQGRTVRLWLQAHSVATGGGMPVPSDRSASRRLCRSCRRLRGSTHVSVPAAKSQTTLTSKHARRNKRTEN